MWKPNGVLLRGLAAVEVHASHWAAGAGRRLRTRYARPFDRGQTTVEYLGIIAVAVVIVLVLLRSSLGSMILGKIRAQIAKIT
jgi:pilus assembly protein Flp/PilA